MHQDFLKKIQDISVSKHDRWVAAQPRMFFAHGLQQSAYPFITLGKII